MCLISDWSILPRLSQLNRGQVQKRFKTNDNKYSEIIIASILIVCYASSQYKRLSWFCIYTASPLPDLLLSYLIEYRYRRNIDRVVRKSSGACISIELSTYHLSQEFFVQDKEFFVHDKEFFVHKEFCIQYKELFIQNK